MRHEQTELKQAENLNMVIENVHCGERDMFDGVQAKQISRASMELIDLAVFVLPVSKTVYSDDKFHEQLEKGLLSEIQRQSSCTETHSKRGNRAWHQCFSSFVGLGLAIAAFCVALLAEPMPMSREGRSIDTLSQPWYNSRMGNYTITPASDNGGNISYFGFSDAGSGFRALVYR